MKRIALLLTLAFGCSATTVYLRSGAPGSFVVISNATNATPIVVTTSAAHGFVAGDLIYIQQVYGNWNANGLRKVMASPAPTSVTFAISDISDTPIAGNGNWDTVVKSGFAGKVAPYTLVAHPRLLLDGPGGPTTSVMDGSVTKSIRADITWPVFQGLVDINNRHTGTADTNAAIKSSGCDWGPMSLLLAEG